MKIKTNSSIIPVLDFHTENMPIEEVLKDTMMCLDYAISTKKRFIEGELIIAKDPWFSVEYADHVLHGPFDLGEINIIATKDEALINQYVNILKHTLNEQEMIAKLKDRPEFIEYAIFDEPRSGITTKSY